jgi:hypothetical protein
MACVEVTMIETEQDTREYPDELRFEPSLPEEGKRRIKQTWALIRRAAHETVLRIIDAVKETWD